MLTERQITLLNALALPGLKRDIVRSLINDPEVLKGLTECSYNLVRGNIPLDDKDKKKLSHHKDALHQLVQTEIPSRGKRGIVLRSSGLLSLVIPSAIEHYRLYKNGS
jgi:hypothetical protein